MPERSQGSKAAGLRDRRLRVAVVELSAGSAGEVAEYAVEDRHPGLVDVESLTEELAQQPTRLRDAIGEGVVDTVSPEVRHHVADCQQSAAGNGGQ